jgi:glycosyltransferase involved in cell wall biosynthesis
LALNPKFTVTVGVCVKNGAPIIKTAIASLCRQTFPHHDTELFVVDGNSKDNTLQLIKANLTDDFGSVRILQENSGLGVARQMVVMQANGKYIVWLDADMELADNYLANQVAFMEQHPQVGIAGGKYRVHIGHGLAADLENIVYAVDSVYGNRGSASKYGYLPGAEGAIYRVKAVRSVGGFDPKINGAAEDTEMAYRVRASGWQLATTTEMFTESTRATWPSLWKQYVWYGRGGHFIYHKDPGALNFLQMTPVAGFVAGVMRLPGALMLTHKTGFLMLPFHYTYKRIAWLLGFSSAHCDGYGHPN